LDLVNGSKAQLTLFIYFFSFFFLFFLSLFFPHPASLSLHLFLLFFFSFLSFCLFLFPFTVATPAGLARTRLEIDDGIWAQWRRNGGVVCAKRGAGQRRPAVLSKDDAQGRVCSNNGGSEERRGLSCRL
jgi:hypothetical protein